MSNIALIQPRRVDFDTTQITDWLDGLPILGTPGLGGTLPGAANVGNGSLGVAGIERGTSYGGHVVKITGLDPGQTYLSVTDPDGIMTATGFVGLPVYASGLRFTLAQGVTPFAGGDSFAVSVLPIAIDVTGIRFDLDARAAEDAAGIALSASSGGISPTIAVDPKRGVLAMNVPRASMAGMPAKPEGYPYGITATDLVTNQSVPVFYGLIHHTANVAQIGQGD